MIKECLIEYLDVYMVSQLIFINQLSAVCVQSILLPLNLMKDKFSFLSPQASKAQNMQSSINFKKSPNKFAFIDPYYKTKDNLKNSANQTFTYNHLENVKKIPSQYSQLRQTMNFKNIDYSQWRADDQLKNNKNINPSQSLRQTMDSMHPFKNRQQYSHSYHSEHNIPENNEISNKYEFSGGLGYSRKASINLLNQNKTWNNPINPKKQQQGFLQKYKNQLALKKNKSQSEKLRAQNDKIIEQLNLLKKITLNSEQEQKQGTYLSRKNSYNINSNEKTPQIGEEIRFRKNNKKQSDPMECYTPTISKHSYQERFKQVGSPTSTNNSDSKSPPNRFIDIPDLKKKNTKLSLEDFNIMKTLGEGKFGTVMMVKHKKTNSIFALKKIPKSMIKSHLMVEQLALEIRIQTCLSHKNILGIYGFFDDAAFLYIVLQYMQEGTLYSQLKKHKILQQKEAAQIILQITHAINFLHDHQVAHRDIKPQNIVISNGVYKLCDFGWATICNQRRKTYCGTIDYTAPQILQGSQYDMTVDLWCLGVLTYQLLVGKAPFYHLSRKQTMKKILNVQNQSIVFPPNISQKARDFMQQLIKKNSGQRMKTSDALKHPFLNYIQEQ